MTAACGKKEEAAEPEKEETKVEAEKEAESAEEDKEDDVKEEEPEEAEKKDEPVNEYGITASQEQALYACIKEAVLAEYIQPNNIEPSKFVWPDKSYSIWRYIDERLSYYSDECTREEFLPDPTTDVDPKLSESLFIGVMKWVELLENGFEIDTENQKGQYAGIVMLMLRPASEKIPANVTFTE